MTQTTANQHPRDRLRGRIDRGVQAAVTACGLMVLMTLMLIFVYLLFAVLPLFKPASVGQAQPLPIAASSPALALGMDVQQRVGYRIDAQGSGQFYRLSPAPSGQAQTPLAQQTLLAKPALLAQAAGERDLFALAQADGRLVVARADFATAENGRPQWLFPLGQPPLALDPQRKPLKLLSLADAHRGQYLLAGVTDDRRLVFGRFSPDRPPQFSERPLEHDAEQLVLTPDGRQLYLLAGNRLARYQIDGAQLQLRETRTLGEHAPYQMTALPGGSALLIKGADGNLREWFEVEKEQRWRLTPVQHFDHGADGQELTVAEPYRRVFATLRPDGGFSLFSTIQPQPLLNTRLGAEVRQMAFAPRGDGLLLESAQGWQRYALDNPYPDVTWRSLWGKVWYENYPQPAYVW
ncbi:phosphate ABC transporter permease, partial [Serratia marcescens]